MAYDAGAIIARLLAQADGFLTTMSKVDRKMEEQQKRAEALARGYKALTIAGSAVAGAVTAFTVAGLKGNAMIEQFDIGLKVLLKDEKAATEAFEYLVDLANRTPFQMPEVVQAGRMLAAYGLEIRQYTQDVADLAAGMGVSMTEAANAFGKLASGATGEAMERLRYMGISMKDFIEEGIRFAKSGQAEATTDQMLDALQRIIQRRFGGMVDEQSKTWNGMISTLQDTLEKFEREATKSLFDALKPAIKGLIDLLNSFGPVGSQVIGSLTMIAGALGLIVAGSAAWFAWNTKITASLAAVKLAMGAVMTNPWVLAIAGAVTLGVAIKGVIDANRAAQEAAEKTRQANIQLGQSYLDLEDRLSKTKAGTKEHAELESQHQSAMNDLAKAFPQVIKEYDSLGNVRRVDIGLLKQLIDKENELDRIRRENANAEKKRRAEAAAQRARDAVDAAQRALDLARQINPEVYKGGGAFGRQEAAYLVESAMADLAAANERLRTANAELAAINAEIAGKKTAAAGSTAVGGTGGIGSEVDAAKILRDLAIERLRLNEESLQNELKILELEYEAERAYLKEKLAGRTELNEALAQLDENYAVAQDNIRREYAERARREAQEEYDRELAQRAARVRAREDAEDAIRESMLSEHELALHLIDERAREYLDAGANEILVAEWVAAEKKKILDREAEEQKKRQREILEAQTEQTEAAVNAWTDLIYDYLSREKSWSDIREQMLREAAKRALKIIIDSLIQIETWRDLLNALGQLFGIPAAPSGSGTKTATGSIPRAHSGMDIPDSVGEMLVIARGGERILSPEENRAWERGGRGGGGDTFHISVTVPINALDTQTGAAYLSSPAFTDVLAGQVQRAMARRGGRLPG